MSQHANAISTAEARENLADLINRATYTKERLVLTRRGKAVAALVPLEDLELLEALENLVDLEDARAALAEAEKEGTLSWSDFKKSAGL
jgi:prevent-host-death family protein